MSAGTNTIRPKAQATEVSYELHTLGWKAFQNLCVTIAGEIWGQTVQSYFDSHDGGRDGAFHGIWKTKEGEVYEGSFTAQCKFTAKADKQLHLSDLKDELSKAKRLAAHGLSDNYFLFTNAKLTGSAEEEIRAAFQRGTGIKQFAAYGADRISLVIRESSRLRMLVPRVYGLGDLSQILDERAYDQAQEILSALGDDLAKFVITEAYQRSAKALVEHGFVLLLGEPACGKSTIAAALAVGALDEWRCSTVKIRNADDFVEHSNPHEPKQFFWVDDAFGATQLDSSSAAGWNHVFPHIHAAIRRGARVLFTSRDYIYNAARQYLKESALPVLRESQVVIHVEQLTKDEREQILYNHIRLGSQPLSFRRRVKPFLLDVATHSHFSPEIARRLGNQLFTKRLIVSKDGLDDFVAHPVELLCEIVRTIDTGSRSALALIFMRGGMLPCPINMTTDEERAVSLMGGSISDVRNALDTLKGSLILQSIQGGSYSWRFKHPTVRDAFAAVIAEDHELMDIYLAGAPVERLLDEVTCGDVGILGVKVIVPPDRYESFTTRLESFDTTNWKWVRKLHRFLAYRCDHKYLAQYITRFPGFISSLKVHSYLNAVSDVDVIVRLHEFGLLPEEKRISVYNRICELVIETPDAGFIECGISELIKPDEMAAIWDDIRAKLIPKLDHTIDQWRFNFEKNSGEAPDDYFYGLVNALESFKKGLEEHPDLVAKIDSALTDIEGIVDEMQTDQPQEPDEDDYREYTSDRGIDNGSRSIFDDVDQ